MRRIESSIDARNQPRTLILNILGTELVILQHSLGRFTEGSIYLEKYRPVGCRARRDVRGGIMIGDVFHHPDNFAMSIF